MTKLLLWKGYHSKILPIDRGLKLAPLYHMVPITPKSGLGL